MESKFFVQTDRELIEETLTLDGSPIDLTNRSVETVFVHEEAGQIELENTTQIVDAVNGVIRHQFTTQDLNRTGNYTMEWVITGGPDDPTTVPKRYPVDVHVRAAGRLVENASAIMGIDANRVKFDGRVINPREVNATTLNAVDTNTDDLSTQRISSPTDIIGMESNIDMGGNEVRNLQKPADENSAARLVDVQGVRADFNTHTSAVDAHHSRYTDQEVMDIIQGLTSLDIDVSGSAGHATVADDARTLDGNLPSNFVSQDDFDFHEAQSGIHHQRYQDSEAVTAINNETSLNVDIQGNADTATYAEYADVVGDEEGMYIRDIEFNDHTSDPFAHHEKWSSFDTLQTVNNEEQLDVSITGNASTADFADTAGSLEGSGAGEFASAEEFNLHSEDDSAHHVRYSDLEAVSALDDSEIMPAEILQPSHKYLDVSARFDQEYVLNRRLGFAPNAGDTVSPLGWINNFLYRSHGEARNVTVSPSPSSGTIGNMFRPSGYAEWSVDDLPVSIEFELPENEVFAFFANSPTSQRYAVETATLELRVNGSWQEFATSNGRPYIFDGFYNNNATHGRITFSGPSDSQRFFRVDCIAGYTESNQTQGLYLSREGGRMHGNINMDGNDILNIGNIDSGTGGGGGGIGGEEIQTADGTTRVFTWDAGVDINHVQVTPTSDAASGNYQVSYSGSQISVTYAIEPDNGDQMSWFWLVNGADGSGGSVDGNYVTQSEFDSHANDSDLHGGGSGGVTSEEFDTHVQNFENHVTNSSIHGGHGGRYPATGTITADGTTDTFTWVANSDTEITAAIVDAATSDASTDFTTSVNSTTNEITVTYSTNPEGELAWFWLGDGSDSSGTSSDFVTQSEFDTHMLDDTVHIGDNMSIEFDDLGGYMEFFNQGIKVADLDPSGNLRVSGSVEGGVNF